MDRTEIQQLIADLEYDTETIWYLIDLGRVNDSAIIMDRILNKIQSFQTADNKGSYNLEAVFPVSFWEKNFQNGLKVKDVRLKIREISQDNGKASEKDLEKIGYVQFFWLVRSWVSDNIFLLKQIIKSPQQRKRQAFIALFLASFIILCGACYSINNLLTQRWGLQGDFYLGENFEKLVSSSVSKTINFSSPEEMSDKVTQDHYSARWQGYLLAPEGAEYTISMEVDDGARLFIDGRLLIDVWRLGRYHPSQKVTLSQGPHKIVLEYFQHDGPASMQLYWSIGKSTEEIIQAKYLRVKI